MKHDEIVSVATMTEAEFAALWTPVVEAERATYANYHGYMPRAKPGSPQMAGYGSEIGGFVGQEQWLAARGCLSQLDAARRSWQYCGEADGAAVYQNTFFPESRVEIVTHGLDLSSFGTPAEAISHVREAVAV